MNRRETVWKILTLPCTEATRLSSEALDRTLAVDDRLAVRLHIIACASCRRYRRQIEALRKLSTRLAGGATPPGSSLPDDARERIRRSLRDG